MRVFSLVVAATFLGISALGADTVLVKSGEKIAFLGDSITQQGARAPGGYVQLVINGLKTNGINATAISAGIGGNRSDHMLARLKTDVLDKHPDWMLLSCGVNDVWQGAGVGGKGVSLEDYKKNVTAILDQCQAAKIKVLLLTPTMLYEDSTSPGETKLELYREAVRALAKERGLPLADLGAAMREEVKRAAAAGLKGKACTYDGVHMNPSGNMMMALGVLKAFDVGPDGLVKAEAAWLDIPAAYDISGKPRITLRHYHKLTEQAIKTGKPIQALLDEIFAQSLAEILKENDP